MRRIGGIMEKFTQAYDAARAAIITEKKYESAWQTYLDTNIATILDLAGPNATHAAGITKLRGKLKTEAGKLETGNKYQKMANTIYDACVNSSATTTVPGRAAALKMMKHLYWAKKSGGQSVWVYSPPKAYTKWVFDEIKGNKRSIVRHLKKTSEVYTTAQRKVMCDAVMHAKRATLNAATKLGTPNRQTRRVFKRWFGDLSGNARTTAMTSLASSFLSISNVLGSTTLILSDEPNDRNTGTNWEDWGFVYAGAHKERLRVVYVQNAFLKAAGNSGLLWMCVLTLVHELSHYVMNTKDYRYDNGAAGSLAGTGLKPGGTFTSAKAMNNADNLAYFCVDLMGTLSRSDRIKALSGTI
ncbi:MAG: M35 family metallo-endopeptidase [Candidatus Sedimenticola sp. (ex Thyasira tokunagai)]